MGHLDSCTQLCWLALTGDGIYSIAGCYSALHSGIMIAHMTAWRVTSLFSYSMQKKELKIKHFAFELFKWDFFITLIQTVQELSFTLQLLPSFLPKSPCDQKVYLFQTLSELVYLPHANRRQGNTPPKKEAKWY